MHNIINAIHRGLVTCIGLMLFSGLFPGVQAQDCESALTITRDKNYVHTLIAREPIKDCLETGTKEQVQQSVAYVDGLGRSLQQVAVMASPGGEDWVTGMEYDGIGRARKQYLHFMDTLGEGGIYRTHWKSLLAKDLFGYFPVADTSKGYSEQILETSPRNRVSRVAAPGYTWSREKGEHLIVNNYLINTLADAIPNLYVEEDLIVDLGTYAEGELAGVRVRDENVGDKQGESITWTNKAGQTVMKMVKVMESGQVTYMRTLYIYDGFGNLRYVVQPQGMKLIEEGAETMASLSQSGFQGKWMFCYDYDRRNRMIRKRVPGAVWVSMVYDERDRLVATQDGNQREKGEWLFTKYDRLNRPILTGITKVTQGSIIRSEAIDHYVNGADWGENHVGNARLWGYTNKSYPTFAEPGDTLSKNDLLTVTYYDNYDFTSEKPPSWAITSAKGQVTGTKVRILGTDTWLTTVTFYDKRYRVIKTVSDNLMGGQDSVRLSYLNAISPLVTRQVTYHNGDKTAKVTEEFSYDHRDRLLTATHKINEGETVTLVKNKYDERGQLVKKKLGITETTGPVQSVDYEYNIRGWLTKINKGRDVGGGDRFGMELIYDAGPSPQYNGNIGQQIWKVPSGGDVYTGIQDYEYIYDAASRIKQAKYTGSGNFNVNNISYDHNGNILTLKRNSLDSLDYDYEGNQLTWVGDGKDPQQGFEDVQSTKGTTEYVYDSNGNMISDLNKGITNITYNHLNLPEQVTLSNGDVVTYTYDATGVKWRKSATTGAQTKTWDYNGGIHYTNQNIKFILHAEGRAVKNGTTYDYEYNLTDHLGNVRVSVNAIDSAIQRDDYYPFGLTFNHWNQSSQGGGENNYQYNGKEKQQLTNWLHYGVRFYDPEIGRWSAIDPLADKFNNWSPYHYVYDNPIRYTDPDGAQANDPNCPDCLIDDGADALAAEVFTVKHSFYNLFTRFFGYEATFVESESGSYRTGFVETNDGYWATVGNTALDILTILSLGRGGGPSGGLFAKNGAGPVIANSFRNLKILGEGSLSSFESSAVAALKARGDKIIAAGDLKPGQTMSAISLGIDGKKAADILSVSESGRFNITEVKGAISGTVSASDISKAINQQIPNTIDALMNGRNAVNGAKIGTLELAIPSGAKLGGAYSVSGNQLMRATANGGQEVVRVAGNVVNVRYLD